VLHTKADFSRVCGSRQFDDVARAAACDLGEGAPWTDPDANALGDPATNYYYVLVGAFDFALVPGT
jgi:hypothetical protein